MTTTISGLVAGNTATARASNGATLMNALTTGGPDTYVIPKGTWAFDANTMSLPSDSTRIFGEGEGVTNLTLVGNGYLFHFNGKSRVHIAGLTVQGYGNHTGGFVFEAVGPGNNNKLTDLHLPAIWNAVRTREQNDCLMENIKVPVARGESWFYLDGPLNKRSDVIRLRGIVGSSHTNALAGGYGTGLVINGFVHTVLLQDFNATRPYRGLHALDLYSNPAGNGPTFLEATSFRCDYPVEQAALLSKVEECYFMQSYFHGSQNANNIHFEGACSQVKVTDSKITGAYASAVYTDSNDTELRGNNYAYSNQGNVGGDCIRFGATAWTGRVVGGSAKGGAQVYGIQRANPNAFIQRCCTSEIMGVSGAECGF